MPRSALDPVLGGGQASYIMLLTCEEGGHDMRACSDLGPAKAASCHTRCCQPWQIYHHHSGSCVYTKSKYLERYRYQFRVGSMMYNLVSWNFCQALAPNP